MVILEVKSQCMVVVEKLIFELSNHFSIYELINSLGIVYPQFWLSPEFESSFQHFNVIKLVYYVPKKHGHVGSGFWIPLMVNPTTLDMQRSLFVLTMKDNCHVAMVEPCSHNLLTILWKQFTTSQIIVRQMSKYIKLAKIVVI
jgi:hypothetical protein